MTAVIEVEGGRKTYRRWRRPPHAALDGLDLSVPEGGVFGFLGPNGSGKTTTIRILLGLIRAETGAFRLLGQPVPQASAAVAQRVGALVEVPLFFPGLSARTNLQVLADTAGVSGRRVEECLDIVGLRDRAGDRYKGFSLGMRQRLAIAAALLKDPALLILDEPSNGLDPAGIREVRELIRTVGQSSRCTVFVSSHLLSEVEQMCDRLAIVDRGRTIASGTVGELLAGTAPARLKVRVPDPLAGLAVLQGAGFPASADEDGTLWVDGGVTDASAVTRTLAAHDVYLSELTPVGADLEAAFLGLTAHAPTDSTAHVVPQGRGTEAQR